MPHAQPLFRAFTDAEAQQCLVHISFKHATPPVTTPAEYLAYLRESLFQVAFNARLFRIGRRESPPFYAAQVRAPARVPLRPQGDSRWPDVLPGGWED